MRRIISGCIEKDRFYQYLLYKEFYSYCMSICRRYCLDNFDAADVLNIGFMKVFADIRKYDSSKLFKLWIRKIMIKTAIDHYQSSHEFLICDELIKTEQVEAGEIIYDNLSYTELLALIQSLSPACRNVFNLFVIDGYTHEEIARLLGISIETSKVNLLKTRQELRCKLQ